MKYTVVPGGVLPPHRSHVFKAAPIDLNGADSPAAIRTIPELIEYNAKANPNAPYCVQALKPRDGEQRHGLRVTMRQLRDAVWRCSGDLRPCLTGLDPSGADPGDQAHVKPDPVALLMDSDVGLLVHLFSLLALGVPAILLSARLSPAAVQHLLTTLKAQAVVASPGLLGTLKAAFETTRVEYGRGGTRIQVARAFEAYLSGNVGAVPAGATICAPRHFVDGLDRNVIILHTSGTTGLPKPVHQPHKMLLGYACCHHRTDGEDVGGLNMSMLPLYHGFGLVVACLALGIGKPILLPPPREISTARTTLSLLQIYRAKSLTTVPYILEEISRLPHDEGIAPLSSLQYVACGGGPLGVAVGDDLVEKGVRLVNHFGSTETGPLSPFMAPGDAYNWHYWPLRRDLDVRFKLLEHVAGSEHKEYYQLSVTPFGWAEPFTLQDLFEKDDGSAAPAFRAVGRQDDLLVLVNGLKVQPKILESIVSGSNLVKGALAFGEGDFEIGLLVEPAQPINNVQEFKHAIWPLVQEACRNMESHAQVLSPASIVILGPGESLPRSDKGSVLRREAYRKFDRSIRQVYDDLVAEPAPDMASNSFIDGLEDSLGAMIGEELQLSVPLGLHDDFFEWGVNSLQVVRIQRGIVSIVKGSKDLSPAEIISADLVYRNPTIAKLCQALRSEAPAAPTVDDDNTLIEDYVSRFSLPKERDSITVLLTGSSGSLGSYLLSHLVSLPQVVEVICFVRGTSYSEGRSASLLEQLLEAASQKGATIPTGMRDKITIVQGNPGATEFGLPRHAYAGLCSRLTHILHTAWPMDFQRPLESFQGQFWFLQNLLQLARDSHTRQSVIKPRLLFVSSIAVVAEYQAVHLGSHLVPEEAITDPQCTSALGYAKAKLVCERILARAAEDWPLEMEVSFVRVGQLSGAEDSGYWNPKEHFPALVRMAHETGAFPRLSGTLSWLPVNAGAAAISELLLAPSPIELTYHVENPVRQDWTTVMDKIAAELGHGPSCFVGFEDWTRLARQRGSRDQDPGSDFLRIFLERDFEHMSNGSLVLDTAKAQKRSLVARSADRVSVDTIAKYVQGWKRAGLLR